MSVVSPELELSVKLHDLHQLLYMRGGIRPVNAAVDELAKLLLMRLAGHRLPKLVIAGHKLEDLTDADAAASGGGIEPWKEAFSAVIALDDLRGRLPDGSTQPVWPLDEPFRLSRTDVLAEALHVLSHVQFGATPSSSLDPLGVAFDTFLHGKYDHAGGLGTYLTPATVARTMAEVGFDLVDPLSDGLVGDPCAGTGRFLAAIVAKAAERISGEKLTNWISENVVGCDQSANSVAMARVNMLSYGAHHPYVFTVADSITDKHLDEWRGQFRLILTNPPFGDGKYDDTDGIRRTDALLRASRGRPKIDPAIAFVARCIDLLAEGGVAGIVLP
ncbi:MAG: HsdM family class I SAM-dependent methyltransferase, partial [Pseudonocardiaceae bacterium]